MVDRDKFIAEFDKLSDHKKSLVVNAVSGLSQPRIITVNPESNLDPNFFEAFGDRLMLYHAEYSKPVNKLKFEDLFEESMIDIGAESTPVLAGTPGYDKIINSCKFSLKTQADKDLKFELINILKYMELGNTRHWWDHPEDLHELVGIFINSLNLFHRLLSLRRLPSGGNKIKYHLVEVYKSLLWKAINGRLYMNMNSKRCPKTGYCYVEEDGKKLFQLYFQGGSEQCLRIQRIDISKCFIHATWEFESILERNVKSA